MEIGLVRQINIDDEMRDSYLSYAMSVIVSRALPDVRDGLKPVQRRILYAMHDMGLTPDKPFRKSARVVGEVLGKYHPHGEQAVYDTMVRLAQDFSMRYPLVDGQGNFGSIDGDRAAAMRYTEARMTPAGNTLLTDIAQNTVDFKTNFDDSMKEPTVLPCTLPNLLANGSTGIAVGMSTNIPPHNLGEVIDALAFMIDNWDELDDITVPDLMEYIQGPDFPTGGLIFRHHGKSDKDGLIAAYTTGRGKITVRAKAHVEQMERKKSRIVISELPYQTNKTNLLTKIADLHRDGKIEGLTDLRDESDRNGMRIILETTRNVEPKELLSRLFRLTPLQTTFSIIMVALVNGEPRVLTLKQALRHYLNHRIDVVRRRSEHELARLRDRAHILEGLLIALDNLDEVIDIIRRSRRVETARQNLRKKLKLTERQAQAILDMQLRRLAALEQRRLKEAYQETTKRIKELEKLLANPKLMRKMIKLDLLGMKETYGDTRRSQIIAAKDTEVVTTADLLPDEQVWVMVGEKGTLARTTSPEPVQVPSKPDEPPLALLEANTQDILYLFSADGQAVSLPVYQLPRSRELGQGTHWADLTTLTRRNHVSAVLVRPPDSTGYLFLTTVGGVVKRIDLDELPGITSDSFTVMNVQKGDSLGWARFTTGKEEIVLATTDGQLIRFKEDSVRAMGLAAGGVMGMKLKDEASGLVAMDLARPGHLVLSITDNGLAKATPMDKYPVKGRYGQGVINLRFPKGASEVAAVAVCDENAEVIVTTANGRTKTLRLNKVTIGNRPVVPRSIMKIGQRNRVTGVVLSRSRPGTESDEPAVAEQLTLLN